MSCVCQLLNKRIYDDDDDDDEYPALCTLYIRCRLLIMNQTMNAINDAILMQAVFKNYDHDKDGFISHAEFDAIAGNFPFIDSFAVLDADQYVLSSH